MSRHLIRIMATLAAALTVPAVALSGAATATATTRPARAVPAPHGPVAAGRLRITGALADGGTVTAGGLRWRPGGLPAGDRLLSFQVGYAWKACRAGSCRPAADSTATPFAARRYLAGHADTGRRLMVTETATEVVQTTAAAFTFRVLRARRSASTSAVVAPFPRGHRPRSEFVNGLPEARTGSAEEYFQVSAPHFAAADGPAGQRYRIDSGRWQAMPARRVFYTGRLRPGPHRVSVLTVDRAGRSALSFRWRVVPLPAPAQCRGTCWYPPHLNSAGKPMRWDWQIGRTFPLQRTGARAVDLYDIDGFLTTRTQVHRIRTRWQASTLPHPRTACYLDLAWEDYRPDASPSPRGLFPAAALGRVYYGYPQERWVDFRQLGALKPMLRARIAMCASKGFDAVELDDIDSFEPAVDDRLLPDRRRRPELPGLRVQPRARLRHDRAVEEQPGAGQVGRAVHGRGRGRGVLPVPAVRRLARVRGRTSPPPSRPASGSARPSTARITSSATLAGAAPGAAPSPHSAATCTPGPTASPRSSSTWT